MKIDQPTKFLWESHPVIQVVGALDWNIFGGKKNSPNNSLTTLRKILLRSIIHQNQQSEILILHISNTMPCYKGNSIDAQCTCCGKTYTATCLDTIKSKNEYGCEDKRKDDDEKIKNGLQPDARCPCVCTRTNCCQFLVEENIRASICAECAYTGRPTIIRCSGIDQIFDLTVFVSTNKACCTACDWNDRQKAAEIAEKTEKAARDIHRDPHVYNIISPEQEKNMKTHSGGDENEFILMTTTEPCNNELERATHGEIIDHSLILNDYCSPLQLSEEYKMNDDFENETKSNTTPVILTYNEDGSNNNNDLRLILVASQHIFDVTQKHDFQAMCSLSNGAAKEAYKRMFRIGKRTCGSKFDRNTLYSRKSARFRSDANAALSKRHYMVRQHSGKVEPNIPWMYKSHDAMQRGHPRWILRAEIGNGKPKKDSDMITLDYDGTQKFIACMSDPNKGGSKPTSKSIVNLLTTTRFTLEQVSFNLFSLENFLRNTFFLTYLVSFIKSIHWMMFPS